MNSIVREVPRLLAVAQSAWMKSNNFSCSSDSLEGLKATPVLGTTKWVY